MAILSIQSHVVYGYVGNRAATFPLQRLGHEVWALNTVQFSNHTGYGSWTGQAFGAEHIAEILRGLEDRGVLGSCVALLSGYLGSAETGRQVLEALHLVRERNPGAIFCCDPVMGDMGRGLFVREDIPAFFRDQLVPASTIVTPNLFELEMLSGLSIHTEQDALKAVDLLHAMGPRIVLVTSYRSSSTREGHIDMLVSDGNRAFRTETPELAIQPAPNGGGDLTAALFLARYLQSGDARDALELVTDSVYAVYEKTKECGTRELRLIEAQDDIAHPQRRFPARELKRG